MESEVTWTKEEFEASVEQIKKGARETFEEDGHHYPIAFVFGTFDPRSKTPGKILIPVVVDGGSWDPGAKNEFSRFLRFLAHEAKAMGIAYLSEIWMIERVVPREIGQQAALELARAEAAKWGKRSLSEHPDRRELLAVMVEHSRFGHGIHRAPILRNGPEDEHPKLGDWYGDDSKLVVGKGRFTHLLPPVN